jgi:hypothetical protein
VLGKALQGGKQQNPPRAGRCAPGAGIEAKNGLRLVYNPHFKAKNTKKVLLGWMTVSLGS